MTLFSMLSAYIMGSVHFAADGGKYEKLLNIMLDNKIPITKVYATSFGFTAKIPSRYYCRLHVFARKCGCKLHIIKKKGLRFSLYGLRKRYGILVGAICFFVLTLIMPQLVWTIDYFEIPVAQQTKLKQYMYEAGIYVGMASDNDKVAIAQQQVLLNTPEYSWLAFNFIRGRMITEAEQRIDKPVIIDNSPSYIVAGQTGIIKIMEVYEGNGLKIAGQSVAAGEMLVTGASQNGFSITHTRSRAKIIAYVEKTYTTTQPLKYTQVVPTGKIDEYTTLHFLNFTLPLYKNIKQTKLDTVQNYQTPLEILGFGLPATLDITQVIHKEKKEFFLSQQTAEMYALDILNKAMYCDLQTPEILSREVNYTVNDGVLTATMHITAYADIGVLVEQ